MFSNIFIRIALARYISGAATRVGVFRAFQFIFGALTNLPIWSITGMLLGIASQSTIDYASNTLVRPMLTGAMGNLATNNSVNRVVPIVLRLALWAALARKLILISFAVTMLWPLRVAVISFLGSNISALKGFSQDFATILSYVGSYWLWIWSFFKPVFGEITNYLWPTQTSVWSTIGGLLTTLGIYIFKEEVKNWFINSVFEHLPTLATYFPWYTGSFVQIWVSYVGSFLWLVWPDTFLTKVGTFLKWGGTVCYSYTGTLVNRLIIWWTGSGTAS